MINRRTFVKGLAAGSAAAGLGVWPSRGFAQDSRTSQATLRGTDFDLRIAEAPVNFTGAARTGITVNGSIPAPLVRWREGDTVTMQDIFAFRIPAGGRESEGTLQATGMRPKFQPRLEAMGFRLSADIYQTPSTNQGGRSSR